MKSWNRKKKPKHMTKMKWKFIIDDVLDNNWLYEKVVKYYSISKCTKRISYHQEWSHTDNEIIKRNRFSAFNCNDMRIWKGF